MAGVLTPVVMLPRYTCYSGAGSFTTIAMDVTSYVTATLSAWRSALVPAAGSPTFALAFEESTDQVSWVACTVSPSQPDPTSTETQYTVTLKRRWFRVKVTLGGTDPVATCWCVGFFEDRES